MVESEKSFQKFQTKLTEKYAESVSKVEHQNVINRLRDCERQASQLRAENANFLEMLNEAHGKLKQIELRKAYHEFEHDALQRCILELQCISDDKNTIGRLTQEIHSLHVNEIKNQDNLQTVQHSLDIAQKTSEDLQNHVEYLKNALALQKQIFNDKIRQLKSLILYLNKRFVGALPLLSEEIWSNQVKRLSQEKFQLMKCSRHQLDETEIQTASIDNLRVQLKSLSFAKTSVDKRLEVAEEVIAKYEALVNSLQTDMINMEDKYEKLLLEAHKVEEKLDSLNKKDEKARQETTQVRKEEDEKDVEVVKPNIKPQSEPRQKSVDKPEPNKVDDEQLTSKIDKLQVELEEKMKTVQDKNEIIEKYNVEMSKLKEKVAELNEKLNTKEEQLRIKIEDLESFKMAIRNRSVADEMSSRDEAESSEKKAFKVTVSSLENIIAQKEITIKNYQTLLEKTKEQNIQTMLDLQNKCSSLQSFLHSREKADTKVKLDTKSDMEVQSDLRPYMNTYLTRIHELEDNLVQVSNELSASKQQTEHWYHMASERLKVITDLQIK
uniref:Centrosomal protein of 290 kDa n=5 Tax=Cacopsylla melanoneura TaxID=428564 RepID=A0A8D8ZTE6_9HEMI